MNEHYKNNIYDLNDIDVSKITNFAGIFYYDEHTAHKDFDVSYWDVSNGTDFADMFRVCEKFNCDLS
ncbi:BspA family leucine-rich repeat surface protein [bacterium]|nr:BspA family leucine-rich repeat surface protein [bacterium]